MTNAIDIYISNFPEETQESLQKMRATILKAAPKAEELISYGMPAYKQDGMLVWFAGYKNHVGFYPGANGIEAFESEFKKYKYAKGSVQFPLDKALPIALITKIVKFKIKVNLEKASLKKTKKSVAKK